MIRYENWPERLSNYIAKRKDDPFAWGVNDCVLFAADCIIEMTGLDPVPPLRGGPTTALGMARRMQDAYGSADVTEAARAAGAVVGFPEISWTFAQRGDVVLLENSGRPCLGICGGMMAYAPGPERIMQVPMRTALLAWQTARQ
ncbi:MAG: hypothetical protein OJJ21_17045 [Ferrovibrio sp.]|uniref:DUF6950 family protein n=1 Tax=Ferrovibrio sp. TaxID=1917215 RepID=UPI0026217C13|nr:hypothetical protein [Ferrovibrio sp.]MCW0235309.1 hypothetical protein [Ferrovibrio sp.]